MELCGLPAAAAGAAMVLHAAWPGVIEAVRQAVCPAWVQHIEAAITPEEADVLVRAMLTGLAERGNRDLRWYGLRWEDGVQPLRPTDPIPAAAVPIIAKVARAAQLPMPNVATIHEYHHARSRGGTGPLKRHRVAIVPHADEDRLAGAGFVAMLQLTHSARLWLVTPRGTQEVLDAVDRNLGDMVVLRGGGYSQMRHAVTWPDDTPEGATMVTLTLRRIRGATPPPCPEGGSGRSWWKWWH